MRAWIIIDPIIDHCQWSFEELTWIRAIWVAVGPIWNDLEIEMSHSRAISKLRDPIEPDESSMKTKSTSWSVHCDSAATHIS